MTSINIGLLFVTLVFVLLFRKTIFINNNAARIANLILKQSPPLPYSVNIVDNHHILSSFGFVKQVNTSDFVMYYKHTLLRTSAFKKVFQLEISYILKNEKIDFYEKDIDEEISKIERLFQKSEKPTKYIIIGYRNYETFNEEARKQLVEVVSYSLNRHSFAQINVGFVKKDMKAYFLYSDSYYPSMYYKEGVEFIKGIINKQKDLYVSDPLAKVNTNKKKKKK